MAAALKHMNLYYRFVLEKANTISATAEPSSLKSYAGYRQIIKINGINNEKINDHLVWIFPGKPCHL